MRVCELGLRLLASSTRCVRSLLASCSTDQKMPVIRYNNGALYPDFASCMVAIDPATRENGCLEVCYRHLTLALALGATLDPDLDRCACRSSRAATNSDGSITDRCGARTVPTQSVSSSPKPQEWRQCTASCSLAGVHSFTQIHCIILRRSGVPETHDGDWSAATTHAAMVCTRRPLHALNR